MAGGSGWNRRIEKAPRNFLHSLLRYGPQAGAFVALPGRAPLGPPPLRSVSPAIGVPGPSSARRGGAATRAHFAPGSLEAEKVNGAPPYGPRCLDEMFSISEPPLFSFISEDNDRTNRRLTDKGRQACRQSVCHREGCDRCQFPFPVFKILSPRKFEVGFRVISVRATHFTGAVR